MNKIYTVLFFSLLLSFQSFGQNWSENFNTKTGNDFTQTGWRFNEDGTFYFSTANNFNMTSRHIRSQNIQSNSPLVTYTGYLLVTGGNSYTTTFRHSCVFYGNINNNGLPRI